MKITCKYCSHTIETKTLDSLHQVGWRFLLKNKRLHSTCGACDVIKTNIKLNKSPDLLSMIRDTPSVWARVKELALDDSDFDELYERVSDFNEFIDTVLEDKTLDAVLDVCSYDDIKKYLSEEAKYRNKELR